MNRGQTTLTVLLTILPITVGILWWIDDKFTVNATSHTEIEQKISDVNSDVQVLSKDYEITVQTIFNDIKEIKRALKIEEKSLITNIASSTITI